MDHLVITNSPARPVRLSVLRVLDFPRLVFAILFLWTLFAIDLHDPDYYWHLKAGEYILTHGALPSVDPFSYTFHGEPWVLHEWLFQVVLYAVFDWLGPFGRQGPDRVPRDAVGVHRLRRRRAPAEWLHRGGHAGHRLFPARGPGSPPGLNWSLTCALRPVSIA